MPLAIVILLSVILISLVILLTRAKEKGAWENKVVQGALYIISFLALIALGIWAFNTYKVRPHAQTEFYKIKLSHKKADVKFIKGNPHKEKDSLWAYKDKYDKGLSLLIGYHEQDVRFVSYSGECTHCENISDIGIDNTYESVLDKFGEPSKISYSQDQLLRLLSFEQYNVFFLLKTNRVVSYGIYNPKYGEIEYQKILIEPQEEK